jgi:hypothetical protein
MTNGTVTQQTTAAPVRYVLAGKLEENVYLITLDGGEVVQTIDEAIATAANAAMRKKQALVVDLERPAGAKYSVIAELRLATNEEIAAAAPATTEKPTGLAKPGSSAVAAPAIPTGLISDPLKLTEQLQALGRHYNVISPMIAVSQFAPGYGVNLVVVSIDSKIVDETTGRGTDTYHSKKIHKPNERALSKNGLLKISQALGIQWAPPKRLDDGSEANRWQWQYYGVVRNYDGQLQPVTGSRELDLRTGSAEAAGMSDGQLKVARTFGNEICETKAMERAIRNYVRQVYTVEELAKPFLIPRFSFTPDMSDPEIKKLVTERALNGMSSLYPPPAVEMPSSAAAPAAAAALPAPKSNPFAEPPKSASPAIPGAAADFVLPDDAKFIADIKQLRTGERKDKTKWALRQVTATTGEAWTTFEDKHVAVAEEAKAKGWPVRIVDKENTEYPDQLNIGAITLIDPRQGDLLGGAKEEKQY